MTPEHLNKPKYNVRNSLTSYYLLIMFTFFPMFLTESYSHARTDKYWLFMGLTGVLFLSTAATSLVYRSENKRMGIKEKNLMPLSATDICMLCFFGFAGIAMAAAAWLVFTRYYFMSRKHFGGITGDLAGWFLIQAETWMLLVTDNGIPPREAITEGGGITGIRRRAERYGGTVEVLARPRFTVRVTIQEGDAP